MITEENPRFFGLLSGTNAAAIEAIIIRLYDEMYRDVSDSVIFDRTFVRQIVFDEFMRQKIKDQEKPKDPASQASQILKRLEESGWIAFKMDKAQMAERVGFTGLGRRFAQAFFESSIKQPTTRLRNVRSTLNSIRAYAAQGDPQDLMDARQSSEYVVSDLMDRIYEINDARQQIVHQAMACARTAGEVYFEFLEKDFVKIAVSLTDDSAAKHNHAIQQEISALLGDETQFDAMNAQIVRLYPQFGNHPSPIEEILEGIAARVQSACDAKLPEIYTAISAFTRNSEMVLRQANAILTRSTEKVESLATKIKQSDDPNAMLLAFGDALGAVSARAFDPARIKPRERYKRTRVQTVIGETPQLSAEAIKRVRIKEAIREAFGYSSRDVEQYIDKILAMLPEGAVLTCDMPVESYRDLMMALNAPAVAARAEKLSVTSGSGRSENAYFSSDDVLIARKS